MTAPSKSAAASVSQTQEPACSLCRLPIRSKPVRLDHAQGEHRFCCNGCRQVFVVLTESMGPDAAGTFQQTELFNACRDAGIIPSADTPTNSQNAAPATDVADDGQWLDLHLNVAGMWCPACAWLIEDALRRQEGVAAPVCQFATDTLSCRYDPRRTEPQQVVAAVTRLGYQIRPNDGAEGDPGRLREWIRLGVSAFFTMNVMMLSFALYAGFFTGLSKHAVGSIGIPMALLSAIVVFYGGARIHHRGWTGLLRGVSGMESLISIGSIGAWLFSVYNLLQGSIHQYFDTAAMLIALVLVGKLLEGNASERVRRQLTGLLNLRPLKARLVTDSWPRGRYVSTDHVKAGDRVRIRSTEMVPVDGRILSGKGELEEAVLTGEPQPVHLGPGDSVRCGSRLIAGDLIVCVAAVGEHTTLGRMVMVVRTMLQGKAPIETSTDRWLRRFTPTVILLSAATGLICAWLGAPLAHALTRALTVLVIACPCALGIAVPLARVAGISVALQKGLLVRNPEAFEKAAALDLIALDKTGTVTEGKWQLQQVQMLAEIEPRQAWALAAGLEQQSDHPVAREIREQAARRNILPARIDALTVGANGVTGRIDRRSLRLGAPEEEDRDPENPPLENRVFSTVILSMDGRPVARFVFGDPLKASAHSVVAKLAARGYQMALLSGDHTAPVAAAAAALKIDRRRARQRPEQKAEWITERQKKGLRVAMVGDGINDAPALAAADFGVAVYSGTHLGREIADVTLMRGDPAQLIDLFGLSRLVRRKTRQNLVGAVIYNLIGLPLAISGLLNPLVAVLAMLLSSLSVTFNTLSLLRRGAVPIEKREKGGTWG